MYIVNAKSLMGASGQGSEKKMSTPGKGSIKIMNNLGSEQDIGRNMTGKGHLIEMGMRSLLDRNL